jgi:hypothetical protein
MDLSLNLILRHMAQLMPLELSIRAKKNERAKKYLMNLENIFIALI